MDFDPLHHPFPSRRMTVYARNGMVATSQPLAAQAGLEVLRRGGNAIDAAIATAAALTVVEPTSNGIGSDAFAIVWHQGRMYGLNSSGPAPASISIEAVTRTGAAEMPRHGWTPVTVPGAPAAWAALSERFGKLPLIDALTPAIQYAEGGYPISPVLGKYWAGAYQTYQRLFSGPLFQPWFDTFAPNGRAPRIGEIWRSPGHTNTLRAIGETNARAFYEGDLADQIDAFSRAHGGFLRKEDLAAFQPAWVDPIHVCYRGYDVWEIPPNGQGIVALMALNILSGFDFVEQGSAETLHLQLEAIKLAFADGKQFITDPDHMRVRIEDLLSPAYGDERRKLIGTSAIAPEPGRPPGGGTVYLATADAEGNMVSFIQSNYMGFGSGVVIPGTGISLQNRGHTFSLDPQSANSLAPGKRTYHTIIPGFLTKDGVPVGPFGVMGGYMQPQGHVQVIMNTVDFGLNPQAALDAPRWQWIEGKQVDVERFPEHVVQALIRKGHQLRIATDAGGFGRGQIIWRDPVSGVLAGGTEPRTDGSIAAY
ncbi:MAG: gamma-glutamyltransferase family protein [Alicyclobacillus sp.]|nr:gamma-glutamyltransferase family protein [Alicyclobacillus sp.]